MEFNFLDLFMGVSTLVHAPWHIAVGRVALILLGLLLIYLGKKGVLEALLMVPMGLGMAVVNAGVLVLDDGSHGTLFLNPLVSDTNQLVTILQIDWLQPIYTLTFSNGLIACLVFMGIGVLLDVGFVMARPFTSMFLALCGELGTVLTYPLGIWAGLTPGQSAATALIGGADGPMVLFAALIMAKDLFVPITVVAYLYLGLTYGGYPYLIRLMVPQRLRAIPMELKPGKPITSDQKLAFAVIACVLLSLLFPVAAPLFLSLFVGVAVRESGLTEFAKLFAGPVLYSATFFLGLVLGVLCEASVILNPEVLILLGLGVFALTLSAIGGLLGGYVLYFATGGRFNPVIGIAAVSCVPTTAKVAQKAVSAANPDAIILPQALGANISGVITTAILGGVMMTMVSALGH